MWLPRRLRRERGLKLSPAHVAVAEFNAERAFAETMRFLGLKPRPTAIVALSNFLTVGVLRALASAGVPCPAEISVIGVDDLDLADIMNPRPTLIAQPILEMTRTAIALLLEQVASGAGPSRQKRIFEPRLVERDSCGPAPV